MNSQYTNISLPKDLVDEIDKLIERSPLYQSRAEFAKEAIRLHFKFVNKK